jgi:hypothetical protein
MASSLSDFAAEFIAALNDPALTSRVVTTRREFANLRSAPRVGLVETGGLIGYPDRVGEFTQPSGDKARIIALRRRTILVLCHGQTEEQTEQLLHNTIAAARSVLHASFEFGAESWLDQAEGADGFVRHGRLASWEIVWTTPVFDATRPLTVLSGITEVETFGDEAVPCD